MKLVGKMKISANITVMTGLSIGGSADDFNIASSLNTVIKTLNGKPYIPGSSIKGKMRSLLEYSKGDNKICTCCDCRVCKLFGTIKRDKNNTKLQPKTRLIFRDALLVGNFNDYEIKTENQVDRLTGVAKHPRQIERVPSGSTFSFEIILDIVDEEIFELRKNIEYLKQGITLIENDYLGGNGSRGYGQVKFDNYNMEYISFDGNNERVNNIKKIYDETFGI